MKKETRNDKWTNTRTLKMKKWTNNDKWCTGHKTKLRKETKNDKTEKMHRAQYNVFQIKRRNYDMFWPLCSLRQDIWKYISCWQASTNFFLYASYTSQTRIHVLREPWGSIFVLPSLSMCTFWGSTRGTVRIVHPRGNTRAQPAQYTCTTLIIHAHRATRHTHT